MEAQSTALIADDRRELAIKQLRRKRAFTTHLIVYLAVNTMLIVIWAALVLGGYLSAVFFWPIFPIVGWGFGLFMHGYTTFRGDAFSETQIRHEMERLG